MKLTMTGWDIDNYIANFERLALRAGWALPAEGTIDRFRNGLNKMIHSKALDRDTIPRTMDEWKAAARTEVARAKEKYNAGLLNSQRRNNPQPRSRDFGNSHTGPTQPRSNTTLSNSGIVPMDVNAVNATPFKRLTPEEHAQLAKEGRCFRCRLQGHMARNCPKNKNPGSHHRHYRFNHNHYHSGRQAAEPSSGPAARQIETYSRTADSCTRRSHGGRRTKRLPRFPRHG